jgi:non-lysosomal glucosylceramidase
MTTNKFDSGRRDFFKQAAGVIGTVQAAAWPTLASPPKTGRVADDQKESNAVTSEITFPRVFKGEALKMLAMPLGGVAAGSLALGGRGQLRDWEIFNRPNKGYSPDYAFPAIWAQSGSDKPVTRVLEARILPPYEGQDGLGSNNAPGLSRLANAEFTGHYPLAHIRFTDPALPVDVELEAFSPFIPHDPDESGLPVAILRYHVRNTGHSSAKVSIAFSIDNPVEDASQAKRSSSSPDKRMNDYREDSSLQGLFMSNPSIAGKDPRYGSFVLAVMEVSGGRTTSWRGWPKGRWWNAPMLFWDRFSRSGSLDEEPSLRNQVGALCQQHTIVAGGSASITFLLAWHFPNRTPGWCGWDSPAGGADTIIGNYYSLRFRDAWDAATYAAAHLSELEQRTKLFANAFAESTIPDVVKEAASANLSTLASTTCFRTADGAFHGFEGSDDKAGCCFGNCTHVWNYETATTFLFPTYARSLREAAFGYSMDEQGGMRFRQLLPDGKERWKIAAADGQMGQILHAYLDWKLSGDEEWLKNMWPRVKKAVQFPWIPGGWDPSRRGVFDGVQHTTYDVEFYGPNPLGGIYYLGGLRAAEEMARAVGDDISAADYHGLFLKGSKWIDDNLFQGEYYQQQVRGFHRSQIASQLISGFGSESTEKPEYQVGGGCLIDQLLGQYLAYAGGLGPLVSPANMRTTLESIYRYNYKRTLIDHDSVQRTYALNDEAAVVVCDYGKAERPEIPFPYYAEAWTGLEYSVAALMFYNGMAAQGTEYIQNLRSRYDGVKRNPWDEAECGHHYARAMSSWTSIVALSGFEYDGSRSAVIAVPRLPHTDFKCFWSNGTGWGIFSYAPLGRKATRLSIWVLAGKLMCRSVGRSGVGASSSVEYQGTQCAHRMRTYEDRSIMTLEETMTLVPGSPLNLDIEE